MIPIFSFAIGRRSMRIVRHTAPTDGLSAQIYSLSAWSYSPSAQTYSRSAHVTGWFRQITSPCDETVSASAVSSDESS